ncbi:GNAT family N-acetyltransferase [Nocardioides mesophilus]|uniref:GNAT family N-acetyltransferase n=1 Tax=Nocardioides mesophilus TaxID=433659 RepID=A0A7G9RHM9_9ACTN|nr:GNAT family N-acetyltransferase [Nocardioides mesophilus]
MRTERLVLRGWGEKDRAPFAALNADPEVMEHFPAPLTRAESDAWVDRIERHFDRHGFGWWALEAEEGFIGFTGLAVPRFHAGWMDGREQPVVEVGWRLRRSAWGRGYATEAARECLRHAFEDLGREEVVSFTVVGNTRSRAVMERLGMRPLALYDHPVEGRAALPSVCYLLTRRDRGTQA